MFLNYNATNNKKLTLGSRPLRERSFLSSLDLHKPKSYSTSTLKEQFQKFKKKSLSHSHLSSLPSKDTPATNPLTNNHRFILERERPHQLKIDDFRKSYLNNESKLSKGPVTKDLKNQFKSTGNQMRLPPDRERRGNIHFLQSRNSNQNNLLRQQNSLLREKNNVLQKELQEQKRQRTKDLELIQRQNQIIQNQQELLKLQQTREEKDKYGCLLVEPPTFSPSYMRCPECEEKYPRAQNSENKIKRGPTISGENKWENQVLEKKVRNLEEEKKLMKSQIHSLVYECEQLKHQTKKLQQKYEGQMRRNQQFKQIQNYNCTGEIQKSTQKINKKPYLNLYYQSQFEKPVSQKNQGFILSPKCSINEGKYLKEDRPLPRIQKDKFNDIFRQEYGQENPRTTQQQYQRNFQQISPKMQKEQNRTGKKLQWCANQNIKKYLEEINKAKIQEIDQIQNLLTFS